MCRVYYNVYSCCCADSDDDLQAHAFDVYTLLQQLADGHLDDGGELVGFSLGEVADGAALRNLFGRVSASGWRPPPPPVSS